MSGRIDPVGLALSDRAREPRVEVVNADTFDPLAFALSVKESWANFLRDSRGSSRNKRDIVYASGFSECARCLALDMMEGDKLPEFDADTLARFRLGDDRETCLLSDLRHVGRDNNPPFTVVGHQERFSLKDKKGREVMSGRVDGRVDLGHGIDFQPPLEIKSWSPMITASISVFSDLFANRWTKRGAYQMLAYLLGSGEPFGFILLDKRGLPDLIPVTLGDHLEEMEAFLHRAEVAMDAKESGVLPDYHGDFGVCRSCDHCSVTCHPPMDQLAGASVIIAKDVIEDLDTVDRLSEAKKEYDRADRRLKKRLENVDGAIAGDFFVEGKVIS